MFLQLLSSIEFWIGVVVMLALMIGAALLFIVLDVVSTPGRAPARARHEAPRASTLKRIATACSRHAKHLIGNAAGLTAVAAFWALFAFTIVGGQA